MQLQPTKGAQEEGALERAKLQAGAQIGSAQIRARATGVSAAATQTRADATALATKNHRELQQTNWKVTNNIILKGSKDREILFPKIADEENQDRLLRHLAILKDMSNEEFKEHMKDPVMALEIRSKITSDIYALAKALETTSQEGKVTESLVPVSYYKGILSDQVESAFNDEVMKVQQGIFSKADRNPITHSQLLKDGQRVTMDIPDGPELETVRKAMVHYNALNVKTRHEKGQGFAGLLKSAVSAGFPIYADHTKHMYEFGADSNIHAVLNNRAGNTEIEAAKKFIFTNPNFYDEDTGLIKEDLYNAIALWSPKRALRPGVTHLREGRELTGYMDLLDEKAMTSFRDVAEEAAKGVPLARAALGNLDQLYDAVIKTKTGSSFATLASNIMNIPTVATELLAFAGLYKEKGSIYDRNLIDTSTEGGKELQKQMDAAIRDINLSDTKVNAQKRAESLELILAYQITAVLQGGTGGRTISDTDVKYAKGLFSQKGLTYAQKLERLKIIKTMLNSYVNRGSFWHKLRNESRLTRDHYKSIMNFDSILQSTGLSSLRTKEGGWKGLQSVIEGRVSKSKMIEPMEFYGSVSGVQTRLQGLKTVNPELAGNFTTSAFNKWVAGTQVMTGTGHKPDDKDWQKRFKSFNIVQYNPDFEGEGRLFAVSSRSYQAHIGDPAKGYANASKEAFDITNNKPVLIEWSRHEGGDFSIDYTQYDTDPNVPGAEPAAAVEPIKNPNPVTDIYGEKLQVPKERRVSIAEAFDLFKKNNFTPIAQNVLRELGKLESSNNEVKMGDLTPKADGEINAGWMQWRGSRLKHFQEFAKGKGRSIGDWKTSVEFLIEELTNGEKYSAEEGVPGRKYDKLLEAMQGGNNPDGVPYTYEELYELFSKEYLRPKKPRKASKPSVFKPANILKAIPKVKPLEQKTEGIPDPTRQGQLY